MEVIHGGQDREFRRRQLALKSVPYMTHKELLSALALHAIVSGTVVHITKANAGDFAKDAVAAALDLADLMIEAQLDEKD